MKHRFRSRSFFALGKLLAILGPLLLIFYTFLYNPPCNEPSSDMLSPIVVKLSNSTETVNYPTNISHIKFVLVGCTKTWLTRRPYTEAWWRPNQTRGNIFMDSPPPKEFLPWPKTSPPFQLNTDATKLPVYPKLANPIEARIFRSVLDSFSLGDNQGVRWFVMADDDTVFFIDNLVQVLAKYDHTKQYYVGMHSESVISNFLFAFDMAYGGAGYALSYSLVEQLAPLMNDCLERYPFMHTSDHLTSSCLFDLGVALTLERGIHQIDLLGDISGMISAHPQVPIVTLHHFDNIDPIFPNRNRTEAVKHLMKAAEIDQSRLAQQTICYEKPMNWSVSVSWGYSVHIYESIIPRSILKKPLETFKPWKNGPPPLYMFNTRLLTNDPCHTPHVFFMEHIRKLQGNSVVLTTYRRKAPRQQQPCFVPGNYSADNILRVRVFSNATVRKEAGKIDCCNVLHMAGMNVMNIKLRNCRKGEVIA
ncbi:hypothetical protein ES332_D09G133900v1 [Gossypium tomentosum]|uniref:Fringe-related protein n=1 Tax=Gossypium tomentosum TaxID=34277 RepID=A0A5D2JIS3_GOSTO|nr:hypothetical protein ES332_D09G133900v1 [Gossypium tomentosum]